MHHHTSDPLDDRSSWLCILKSFSAEAKRALDCNAIYHRIASSQFAHWRSMAPDEHAQCEFEWMFDAAPLQFGAWTEYKVDKQLLRCQMLFRCAKMNRNVLFPSIPIQMEYDAIVTVYIEVHIRLGVGLRRTLLIITNCNCQWIRHKPQPQSNSNVQLKQCADKW